MFLGGRDLGIQWEKKKKKKPCQPVLFHDNLHLLSAYYMLETILDVVNVLFHLILTISLKGRHCNFSHSH